MEGNGNSFNGNVYRTNDEEELRKSIKRESNRKKEHTNEYSMNPSKSIRDHKTKEMAISTSAKWITSEEKEIEILENRNVKGKEKNVPNIASSDTRKDLYLNINKSSPSNISTTNNNEANQTETTTPKPLKSDTSKAFLSPPAFHLTQVIHDESCFKKTYGHVVVEVNGDICIYGGLVNDEYVDNFIRYIPGINVFEKCRIKSATIEPRAHCSGNVISEISNNENENSEESINKSIIIFGGINEQNEVLNETFKFDFVTKKWKEILTETKPPARYSHASFSVANKVYIHGGLNLKDRLLCDMWCLIKNKWTPILLENRIPSPRYGHSLLFVQRNEHKLAFLFGGNTKGMNGSLADTWIFNVKNHKWSLIKKHSGKIPCSRWGHSAQLFDNKWMIIYGGITNGWFENYALSDMYAMDIFTYCWFEVEVSTSYNFDRGFYGSLCLVPYKKSMYIFGGYDNKEGYSNVFSITPIITYISYKIIINEINKLNDKVKNFSVISNENEDADLIEVENKIDELKDDVSNITNMMSTFESKFYQLEALNEQCEKILSKDITSQAIGKLGERIKRLEEKNRYTKYKSNNTFKTTPRQTDDFNT